MTSKVEICNAALQRTGQPRITSLGDGTEQSIACNTVYDLCLEDVLSTSTFRSSLRRATLARTTSTPAYGFDYEYQLPVDPKCLRVVAIDSSYASSTEYTVEDDKLLTDASDVSIVYVGMLDQASSYGPFVTKSLIARLAWELSYRATGTQSVTDKLEATYERTRIQAEADDGVQGTALDLYIATLLEVR